jgi:6-phosphogluconolactonase
MARAHHGKMNLEIQRFADANQLAAAAARQWLDVLRANCSAKRFLVALSGGRIAKTFCSSAAEFAKSEREFFNSVHFFWGDERCVPPGDPESNFKIAQELLFVPLNIPQSQIHPIRGEDAPPKAAEAATIELMSLANATRGLPIFDLIFLGMGEDGHTASLFPGEPPIAGIEPVYRAVRASKPPPERITLGYNVLMAAKEVWVLASGAGKETALKESLKDNATTPLGRVLNGRTHTKVFTDINC